MTKRQIVSGMLGSTLFFLLLLTSGVQAQTAGDQWQGPFLLSNSNAENLGESLMVGDPYGNLHAFWKELDAESGRVSIQYAVFDGESWSDPVDIFIAVPGFTVESFSPAIDQKGTLHLMWNEGNAGPTFYSTAPANQALSAHAWTPPVRVDIPAFLVRLQVDSRGTLHVVFINFYGSEPGVYYVRSTDQGINWSDPVWLDPDIPLAEAPQVLHFQLDEQDGLHALWHYIDLSDGSSIGQWVRYAHSLDGGESWSTPITIDKADEEPDELRLPNPGLAVIGQSVHVIWAGNSMTNREHRFSTDRGVTWSEPDRVFGDLHGQAIGDGLVADASGRLHFFGQIRWPQGVYHAVWDGESWSAPSIIYLIARNADEGRNGRYHAHRIRAAARAGNQLVITFTDEIDGPLYTMYHTLPDVQSLTPIPLPSPTPTPRPETTPTPTPTATLLVPQFDNSADSSSRLPGIGNSLWSGVIPVLLLIFGAIMFQLFWNRSR